MEPRLAVPTCPAGEQRARDGVHCVLACAEGKLRARDGIHCCWKGQDWSESQAVCVGRPVCPGNLLAVGESCKPSPPDCPEGMVGLSEGRFDLGETRVSAEIRPFCLDVTEVTAGAYAECVKVSQCSTEGLKCTGGTLGAPDKIDHPVNCVDWTQADAYCKWAGKRLPTEEEWEWAARGADAGSKYPWGNVEPGSQLCWDGAGSDLGKGNRHGTCSVGRYPQGDSPQGVKDLAGNVWEWTSSCYDSTCKRRVSRGGNWYTDDPQDVSAAERSGFVPTRRSFSLGFRCARFADSAFPETSLP